MIVLQQKVTYILEPAWKVLLSARKDIIRVPATTDLVFKFATLEAYDDA